MYIEAYKDMGPPLVVINEFIYMDLSKPRNNNPSSERVVPSRELKSLLNNCIPVDLRGKNDTWVNKKD